VHAVAANQAFASAGGSVKVFLQPIEMTNKGRAVPGVGV
jgi:hypothetical protein